jgi:hypothetical protein
MAAKRRLTAVGHSLTTVYTHTASVVFAILKADLGSPSRKSVAVDHRSVPR